MKGIKMQSLVKKLFAVVVICIAFSICLLIMPVYLLLGTILTIIDIASGKYL